MGEGLKSSLLPPEELAVDVEDEKCSSGGTGGSVFSSSWSTSSSPSDDEADSTAHPKWSPRSSSTSSSSPGGGAANDGPLYQLSSLMTQLPFKRGLSRFYHGKSQSFMSLSEARTVEDLPKRQKTLNARKQKIKPAPAMTKKKALSSSATLISMRSRSTGLLLGTCKPHAGPLHNNLL